MPIPEPMLVRSAIPEDARAISQFLVALEKLGKRTLPSDPVYVREHYIGHPDKIACHVAVGTQGVLLGLQSLRLARDGNPYDVPVGWGIIGTHVNPMAIGKGVGRALFEATIEVARAAGLDMIDATIGKQNHEGLGYYEAMGFRTYAHNAHRERKRLMVGQPS